MPEKTRPIEYDDVLEIKYRCETIKGQIQSRVIVIVRIGSFLKVKEVICGEAV
jgi:hypothetical protein